MKKFLSVSVRAVGLASIVVLGMQNAAAELVSSAPLAALAPSTRAYWDASAPISLAGLGDGTGNGWDLRFGGVTPGFGHNSVTGRDYLSFDSGVSSSLSTASLGGASFFDAVDSSNPYSMIMAVSVRDPNPSLERGALIGDADGRRRLVVNDLTDSKYDFAAQSNAASVAGPTNVLNVPATDSDVFLLIHSSDGSTRRLEAFSNTNSWGEGILGRTLPYRETAGVLESGLMSGDLVLNQSQTGLDFYGAIYLDDPAPHELERASGWAAAQWLLGERDSVVMYQGDSTVEVGVEFADRAPGWNQVLQETHLPADALGQNFANGGKRAIANGLLGLNDPPQAEVERAYAALWNRAGASVLHPIMIGTNDIGAGGADPADVVDAIEEWAETIALYGGSPIWMGCCPDHQGDDPGEGRTAISQSVYDRYTQGLNAFDAAITELRDDDAWGWGVHTNQVAPELMADATHPSSAGNADIASKLAAAFLEALQDLQPLPGDFNDDGLVDAADIDALGVAADAAAYDPLYDLDHDGAVTFAASPAGYQSDSDLLVRFLLATEYGDANLDGSVNALDTSLLIEGLGSSAGWTNGDFNGDGAVNALDTSLLIERLGFTTAPGFYSPEPSSLMLALITLLPWRRRRAA